MLLILKTPFNGDCEKVALDTEHGPIRYEISKGVQLAQVFDKSIEDEVKEALLLWKDCVANSIFDFLDFEDLEGNTDSGKSAESGYEKERLQHTTTLESQCDGKHQAPSAAR